MNVFRLGALACVVLGATLSGCTNCSLVGCVTSLQVSLGVTNEGTLPSGTYQLEINEADYNAAAACQLPTAQGKCAQSELFATASFDGKRLLFTFDGHSFSSKSIPFSLQVDGVMRTRGNLAVNYVDQERAAGSCITCSSGYAAVDL